MALGLQGWAELGGKGEGPPGGLVMGKRVREGTAESKTGEVSLILEGPDPTKVWI